MYACSDVFLINCEVLFIFDTGFFFYFSNICFRVRKYQRLVIKHSFNFAECNSLCFVLERLQRSRCASGERQDLAIVRHITLGSLQLLPMSVVLVFVVGVQVERHCCLLVDCASVLENTLTLNTILEKTLLSCPLLQPLTLVEINHFIRLAQENLRKLWLV